MLNTKQIRLLRRNGAFEKQSASRMASVGLMLALITMLLASCACASTTPPMTDRNILMAVLGEAIGESAEGQEAVARAILNRGNLRGVYGLKNPIIRKATADDWKRARMALQRARTRDITGGAIGWGNAKDLVIFKKSKWFKKCEITKRIGDHWFYREIRKG